MIESGGRLPVGSVVRWLAIGMAACSRGTGTATFSGIAEAFARACWRYFAVIGSPGTKGTRTTTCTLKRAHQTSGQMRRSIRHPP